MWAYLTPKAAQQAGAEMVCHLLADVGQRQEAVALFEAGKYQQVLDLYEEVRPEHHVLSVQPALLAPKS